MSGFGKKVDGAHGRRRAAREQIAVIGTAVSSAGTKRILVEDLSPIGARVCGKALPLNGQEILVRVDEFCLFGRVAWACNNRRGLRLQDRMAASPRQSKKA